MTTSGTSVTLSLLLRDTEQSRIFPNESFGYWKVTVERPVRIDGIDPDRAYSAKELKELRGNGAPSESAHPRHQEDSPFRHIARPNARSLPEGDRRQAGSGRIPFGYPELRDTEQVPLLEGGGIDAFIDRERCCPIRRTAWYDPDRVRVGYEISFNRYFYKPEPLRSLEDIRADILGSGDETQTGLLEEIVGTTITP